MDLLLKEPDIVAKTTIDKNRYCTLKKQFDVSIFGCAGSLLLCGLLSSCGVRAYFGGFSCRSIGVRASVIVPTGSAVAAPGLEHRLNT